MAASVLDSRVLLWRLLANRRDIDILTLELIGKYQIDREACDKPGTRNGLAFDLICCLEIIFDLQRTHLQARNPAEPNRIANRLPYLLSLSTAKGAFMCLVKLATDYSESAQQSTFRWIYIRTLLSGLRMLCLHPNVGPADILSNSIHQNQNFNLQSLDTEEHLLICLCHETLGQIPYMDRNLSLPTSAMNMYPMNDRLLREVARPCIQDFANDTTRKYWTLYDISWSIVAAFVQCLANGPSRISHDMTALASSIANYAIEEIIGFGSSQMNNNGTKEILLLADIVGILYLICKGEMIDNRWRDVYNHKLNTNTSRNFIYQDPAYILALAKFQQTLTKRQKVLRDSDDDILELCSSITEVGLTAVHDYNHYGNSLRSPTNSMRFYITNCHNTHIIAHNDNLSRQISENANHAEVQRAHSISFPQEELCSVCLALNQRKTYTHLNELLPLNKILHVTDQKKQEMNKLRLERQSDFFAEAEKIAKIPESRPHSQKSEQPSPEHPSNMDRGGLKKLKHVSSLSGLKAKMFSTKQNRLSGESSTFGSTPSSAKSETFPQDIKFQHLDNAKKNVTLSADGSLLVFWNSKQLEVRDDAGFKSLVSPLVENPVLAIASTNCCAVVSKKENYDTIKCYNLHSGLECYQQNFDSRVRRLAISADDVYLAVSLDTGILYVINLVNRIKRVKPSPPESAVHCLSFPAKDLLTISTRVGDQIQACNYSLLDGSVSHRLGFSLPEYEGDDQGISSGLHSPLKKLSCFTFWTNSGFPQLYDWGKAAFVQWDKTLKNDLKIENRIYLAVWSRSGKTLVLVDYFGKVCKISINDMNSIEAMTIASTRRVNRKSYDVGQPQLLDVKISQDEAHIIIAWISQRHQAFVQTIPVDQSYQAPQPPKRCRWKRRRSQ